MVTITTTIVADDHQRHSSNTFSAKRGLPIVLASMPLSVAWLEHTTLSMTSVHLMHSRSEFTLHVVHSGGGTFRPHTWHVSRTFDDYVAFEQRLLKIMAYGHACSAECKWLYSFVKKYFPKKALFGNGSKNTMNMRREKLIRYMDVLRSSLLNRGNHGCPIVVTSLANEFTTFIQGRHRLTKLPAAIIEAENEELTDDEKETDPDRVRCCSINSSISTDDDADAVINELDIVVALGILCDLCARPLDGSSDTCAALPCNADGSYCDITMLSCGHQFHDNCVLPKLPVLEFRCPTCCEPQL